MKLQKMTIQYLVFFLICCAISFAGFFSQRYWMPEKYTQLKILEKPELHNGIQETMLDIETKVQRGDYQLVDNIPFVLVNPSYVGSVVKMPQEKNVIPYVKYKIELKFQYPYSSITRERNLDAILVDVNPEQNHQFSDLFWNIK